MDVNIYIFSPTVKNIIIDSYNIVSYNNVPYYSL